MTQIPRTLALATLCLTPALLHAQALPTATLPIGISVFAGASHLNTDYGDSQPAFILGADFTRHLRLFNPSLEVRATISPKGNAVGEETYTGGLKIERRFRNFNPYADLLVGLGDIYFTHPAIFASGPYASDNSFIYVFGAGLDYDLPRNFGLKADFSQQSWRLGSEQNRLTPSLVTIGVFYRIPFRGIRATH